MNLINIARHRERSAAIHRTACTHTNGLLRRRSLLAMTEIMRNNTGVAYLEFALSMPLLILLLFGGIETTRYVLIMQKMEKVSATLSDVVAQSDDITTTQLNQIIAAATQIMLPYDFTTNGYAIITSVTKTGNANPVINWQYSSPTAYVQASKIGSGVNGNATMPANFTMVDKETVIVAEVFYNYKPIVGSIIYNGGQQYRISIYKPRLGNLTVLGWLFPHALYEVAL